jgi:hypothetical protein
VSLSVCLFVCYGGPLGCYWRRTRSALLKIGAYKCRNLDRDAPGAEYRPGTGFLWGSNPKEAVKVQFDLEWSGDCVGDEVEEGVNVKFGN